MMNVVDATYDRISKIFNKYQKPVVCFSGGKDCAVLLEICIDVAKEKNRLPVDVFFLDQEIEYPDTIDFVKRTMYREGVKPHWLQVCFKERWSLITRNDGYLTIYDPAEQDKWVYRKDPASIHSLPFQPKSLHFSDLLDEYTNYLSDVVYSGQSVCVLDGLTMTESPARRLALTSRKSFSNVSWSKRRGKLMGYSPLFDWHELDIFKFLIDNNCDYNAIYDRLFLIHNNIKKLRVSSLIHATAVDSLDYIRELCGGDFVKKLSVRIPEFVEKYQLKQQLYFNDDVAKVIKVMYNGDFDKYLQDIASDLMTPEAANKLLSVYFAAKRKMETTATEAALLRVQVKKLQKATFNSIVVNAYGGTKIDNFTTASMFKKEKKRLNYSEL